jgi:hypothetical protein
VLLLSIDIYGSNLIIRSFSRMGLWKTWSVMWNKMVVKEWLTRIWPRWTKHQRRASRSLSVEVPDVMEKGKWMFNLRSQASHEESHITKCQSLLNQDMKWHGDQKWKLIIRCKVLYVTTSKESIPKQDQKWQPSWSQKEVKWQGLILMQAQVEEVFIFLEYRNVVLLRWVWWMKWK